MQRGVLIAVSVDGHDAVGVFVDYNAVWIHAEGSHAILKLLRPVHNFALVQFICQMRKNDRRKFYPHTDIDAVGHCLDVHFFADLFHPLAAAPADGDDALRAVIFLILGKDSIAAFVARDGLHRRIKIEINARLEFFIKIL